jgi:hypothetical protein
MVIVYVREALRGDFTMAWADVLVEPETVCLVDTPPVVTVPDIVTTTVLGEPPPVNVWDFVNVGSEIGVAVFGTVTGV